MSNRSTLIDILDQLIKKELELESPIFFERPKKQLVILKFLTDVKEIAQHNIKTTTYAPQWDKKKKMKVYEKTETTVYKLTDKEVDNVLWDLALRFSKELPMLKIYDPIEAEERRKEGFFNEPK